MKTLLILTALLLTTPLLSQSEDATSQMTSTLEERIPSMMEKTKVPGLAMAVIDHGKVIKTYGFGTADLQQDIPVQSSTGFNIGSISKLFTAYAVMNLVAEGTLELDQPVNNYLTRWKIPPSDFDSSKVTLRHLLDHTAGISVHGYPGFTDKSVLPSLEESLAGENGPVRDNEAVTIIMEPQTQFKYSGGGYTIIQLVIEEVTKMPFALFMQKAIFKPLKMKNSSFSISKKVLKRAATPYAENQRAVPFEYFTAQAAAGLQTTLDDFILFVNELMHQHQIISKEQLNYMLTPTESSKGKYGLGFRILRFGPLEFKGHAGSNTGWESGFFLDFKTQSGLIMLSNGDQGDKLLQNILKTWARLTFQR